MKELTDEQVIDAACGFFRDSFTSSEAYDLAVGRAAIAAHVALNAADRDVMRQANDDCVTRESALVAIEYLALSNSGGREFEAKRMLAASPTPPAEQPVEMSPDFTDTARAALLWVLWHHQGANSPVGQPIRFALGMGRDDRLEPHQIAEAKQWDAIKSAEQRGCKGKNCGCTDGVSHSEECLAEHAATIDQAVSAEQQSMGAAPRHADRCAMNHFAFASCDCGVSKIAALRTKVEALHVAEGSARISRDAVLAEIDKLGGGV